ncbi:hypothetical protein ACFYTF_29490 [Nocardia thailandica]|uniref:DUF1508 domain-containing protein n=1 Tax=Nocardia thailandica TaxID=257275 RepID=A0ABW6PX15_9NOCA
MAVPDPTVTVTEHTVSCLPIDHRDRRYFEVQVKRHRSGNWYVTDSFEFYGAAAERRSMPALMTEPEAIAVARQIAPAMVVNGHTVAAALAAGGAR